MLQKTRALFSIERNFHLRYVQGITRLIKLLVNLIRKMLFSQST